jgi:hypothetical protein
MKYLLIAISLFICAQVYCQDDPCDCKGTDVKTQYRTKTKHRKTYSQYPKSKEIITPETIIGWEVLYKDKTANVDRSTAGRKMKKIKNTPEDTLYTLKGYLYFIKIQDDCDYHIEIGPSDPTAQRVVVELTKDYCSQQRQLFEYIKQYLKEKENVTISSYKLQRELKAGIPVTMKGLGFYDGWHTPDEHGRKQTHGSSWELHPVVSVEFE